ncbi:hypothetical protein HMPREF0208_03653 [Citrobacter koseri]|nr:hypothetical protein HMPREF3207_04883 [Citrobacter koseri]KXB41505.1 hypothetical protein HMPREF0208_03653 [Citrobacter koseri]
MSSSLILNGLRCFFFSLLSHKGHMITEIRISGKAAMDDLSILIPFLIFITAV